MKTYEFVHGPVHTPRFGNVLYVRVVPHNTCSMDCLYCPLGKTIHHTSKISEYVPAEAVVAEVEDWLKHEERPEAIRFWGCGEATLNSALGEIVHGIKGVTDVPVVVYTNGTHLSDPRVRRNLDECDLVSPSLDAALPGSLLAVNHIASGLDCGTIFRGLCSFCHEYRGRIWLEILIARGFNDSERDIEALKYAVGELENLERIYLNTVVNKDITFKPLQAIDYKRLREIGREIPGNVRIVLPDGTDEPLRHIEQRLTAEEVLSYMVGADAGPLEAMAEGLDVSVDALRPMVNRLVAAGDIKTGMRDGRIVFSRSAIA